MTLVLVGAEAWELARAPRCFEKVIVGVGRSCGELNADLVVNAGVCGGLDPELAPGQIVVATSVNGAPVRAPRSSPAAVAGGIVTVDRIVGSAGEKRSLRERTGAVAVDMEAARILACVGADRFCCVKAVLDTAGESFALDLDDAVVDGRFSARRVLAQAVRRPARIVPELWRLMRRRDMAAKALGEFLGKCGF